HSENPSGGGGKLRGPGTRGAAAGETDHEKTHSESGLNSGGESGPLEMKVAAALRPIIEEELRAAGTRRPEHDRTGPPDETTKTKRGKGGSSNKLAHGQTYSEAAAYEEESDSSSKPAGPPPG
ncbi:hypothetical protein AB0O22_16885, partial [Streptomyces sp. NPDC091204]|uniref:hypothetical protein n=1 Tax=Streptomyces sp. NPDC091204 TaxID=3155299 RepID=UPI003420221B